MLNHTNSVLVMVERGHAGAIKPISLKCLRTGRRLVDDLQGNLIAALIGGDVRSTAERLREDGVV